MTAPPRRHASVPEKRECSRRGGERRGRERTGRRGGKGRTEEGAREEVRVDSKVGFAGEGKERKSKGAEGQRSEERRLRGGERRGAPPSSAHTRLSVERQVGSRGGPPSERAVCYPTSRRPYGPGGDGCVARGGEDGVHGGKAVGRRGEAQEVARLSPLGEEVRSTRFGGRDSLGQVARVRRWRCV